jgi:hypothetical protein
MGAPFLANSQAGVFYPLNWPLIFFSAPVAVKISIIIHVIIAAWGTYALARRVFDLEREYTAAPFAFEETFSKIMLRVSRQARIVHF